MGLTVLEIEVGNPASPDVTEKVEFLIDSGLFTPSFQLPCWNDSASSRSQSNSSDWEMAARLYEKREARFSGTEIAQARPMLSSPKKGTVHY